MKHVEGDLLTVFLNLLEMLVVFKLWSFYVDWEFTGSVFVEEACAVNNCR